MDKDLKTWWEEMRQDFGNYLEAKTQLTKIQVFEKIAKITGVVISFFVLALLIGLVIIFLLIMIGSLIMQVTGSFAIGMTSVAAIVVASFALLAIKRRDWLEIPITNKVIQALYDDSHEHKPSKDKS